MPAKGKQAFGFSDRSGFRYPLKELVPQYINGRPSGLLVGKDELDIDHEQLRLGDLNIREDQSLLDPRPDKELLESRALAAFDPVGGGVSELGSVTIGLDMSLRVGRVTVT
jgi:hypothetical protein